MKTKIFVDTSAFVALFSKVDEFHAVASSYLASLDLAGTELSTTNYVFDETMTRLRKKIGHKAAVHFGVHFLSSGLFNKYYVERDLEKEAFKVFRKYPDKELSFTDCVSFAVMKRSGITKAFTFDADFRKAGFEIDNPTHA
jgi:predicted nucleic acid-binding protein